MLLWSHTVQRKGTVGGTGLYNKMSEFDTVAGSSLNAGFFKPRPRSFPNFNQVVITVIVTTASPNLHE